MTNKLSLKFPAIARPRLIPAEFQLRHAAMVRFKPVPFPSYPLLCSILPSQCTISGKHYSPFTYNKDFWDLSQYCLLIFD